MGENIQKSNVEIYTEIVPCMKPLYHYTSQVGLMGIVSNKHLWFTHVSYMNDSSEYTYALDVIGKVLKNDYRLDIDELFSIAQEPLTEINAFSFSLSEEGDLLSQWRGYCPSGGYSISFIGDRYEEDYQFSKMIKSNSFYIGKCLYEEKHQKELIATYIMESLSPEHCGVLENDPGSPAPECDNEQEKESLMDIWRSETEKSRDGIARYKHELANRIVPLILKYAPLIKHETFSEEREWRIVYVESREAVFMQGKRDVKFRQGKGFLVPYLEIPLCEGDDHVKIQSVTIGPTTHMELAGKACAMYLNQYSIFSHEVKVILSKIPYRN